MTIAIAIKTGSAVVFAADSKVTTSGLAGYKEDGAPNWVIQTYDNAYKIVHDGNSRLMAMVAGHVNVGALPATDLIGAERIPPSDSIEEQDKYLDALLQRMEKEARSFWEASKVPEAEWPGPTLTVAMARPDGKSARVWSASVGAGKFQVREILQDPGIHLEGSSDDVFALLYRINPTKASDVVGQLGVNEDKFIETWTSSKVLSPIDQLNLWAMPTQDAMDFAQFLAGVQVQMDRFLPGEAACGGPIDLMVLELYPQTAIREFPGKTLHHPGTAR
jgi:hypothetical protein